MEGRHLLERAERAVAVLAWDERLDRVVVDRPEALRRRERGEVLHLRAVEVELREGGQSGDGREVGDLAVLQGQSADARERGQRGEVGLDAGDRDPARRRERRDGREVGELAVGGRVGDGNARRARPGLRGGRERAGVARLQRERDGGRPAEGLELLGGGSDLGRVRPLEGDAAARDALLGERRKREEGEGDGGGALRRGRGTGGLRLGGLAPLDELPDEEAGDGEERNAEDGTVDEPGDADRHERADERDEPGHDGEAHLDDVA